MGEGRVPREQTHALARGTALARKAMEADGVSQGNDLGLGIVRALTSRKRNKLGHAQ